VNLEALTSRRHRPGRELLDSIKSILFLGIGGPALIALAARNWPQGPAVSIIVCAVGVACCMGLWFVLTEPAGTDTPGDSSPR
jgi:hypothetical protein